MTGRLPLTLIAAVARNGVIGHDGAMPWRLPGDMAHFRAATLGKPVIMGRRTFRSIGGPLPDRDVVVVSRDPVFAPEGVRAVADLEGALDLASSLGRRRGAPEIMVAGGGQVYAATICRAERLDLTHVEADPDGDTRFPDVDLDMWREVDRVAAPWHAGDTAGYFFASYARR